MKPYITSISHVKRVFSRGMVVMATGVGKTYLATFDSKKYSKILFVAHREEILREAEETFGKVAPFKTKGWFNADEKTIDSDLTFASVQTLSQSQYLDPAYFKSDHSGSDIPSREFLRHRYLTPQRGYLRFLADLGELSSEEEGWLETPIEAFLLDLESTAMTKLYKIPTIRSFVDGERLKASVSSKFIGENMQKFYKDPRLHIDMQDKSSQGYTEWDLARWISLAERNPIKFLDRSSSFFEYDQINNFGGQTPQILPNC